MASPTVRRRELANRLRALRQEAKLTLEDAGKALEFSAATMSRIENAVRAPRVRDVRDLARLYGADERTTGELLRLVEAAREAGWWESYSEIGEEYATLIGLESSATSLEEHRGSTVPGLLQTPDYARAYMDVAINPQRAKPFSQGEIAQRLEVLQRRQEVLHGRTRPAYTAFLDEACLRRFVGGRRTMAEQLARLATLADQPNMSIRLLPFTLGAHPGQPGGFCYISLPQSDVSDVVYVDGLGGQLFLETPENLARHRRVLKALDRVALTLSESQQYMMKIRNEMTD